MILEVDRISFAYNSHAVLSDVRFSVRAGMLVAILGPNGVGKTTLLKCINAILRPRSGVTMVEGADVLRMAPREVAARIGYVPQRSETARVTVLDAVLMGRTPHIRWTVRDVDLHAVEAALARLGLSAMALRHIDELSGGELQKVSLARALVQEPRLLLLDEPTSSLDLRNQVEVLSLLRRVVDENGIATIMTMHDINAALRFCDAALFVKDGAIRGGGPVSAISAELISDVYGIEVQVHRVGGAPIVIPNMPITEQEEDKPRCLARSTNE
jgi:iron complex transport system ATP-binding protein